MDGPSPSDVTQLLLAWSRGDRFALDARQARIVELRFFGGLTIEETAEVLQVSPATVRTSGASRVSSQAREGFFNLPAFAVRRAS